MPTNITAGSNLQAGETGDVLLSENNSAYFGAGVGDTVTILGQPFTVVGIYSPSSVSDTQTLYMNIADAQSITNNTGYITSFTVFAQNSDDVSSVASAISALHPELTVSTAQDRESNFQLKKLVIVLHWQMRKPPITQQIQLQLKKLLWWF